MTKYGIDLESDEAHLLEFFAKTGGYGSVESYLKYLFTYGDGMMNQIVSDMLDDYRKRGEKFCMEEGVTKEEVETVIQCIAR
ncbi:MAG: hypothetical protein ACREA8_08970, partial [Nitrosotalea sp.]